MAKQLTEASVSSITRFGFLHLRSTITMKDPTDRSTYVVNRFGRIVTYAKRVSENRRVVQETKFRNMPFTIGRIRNGWYSMKSPFKRS